MEHYEIIFYTSLFGAISTLIIFLSSVQKYIQKERKQLAGYFMMYILFGGVLATALYTSTAYISWRIPWEVSFQVQCIIYALVFSSNIIGAILLGEFCNFVFYKSNKKISIGLWSIGLVLALIFFLGGVFGYSHYSIGENNNDIKFEFYLLYYLFFFPIILTNIIKIFELLKNVEIDFEYRRLLRHILFFFLGLVVLFIAVLADVFVSSNIDNVIAMLMIPICCFFAYLGFFGKSAET
jgi:hypothetical protein